MTNVSTEATFEIMDTLPTSSVLLIAKKYVVTDWRPEIVITCAEPGDNGGGAPDASIAASKFPALMADVE